NGWAIGDGRINPDTSAQDRADAESLYRLLSDDVVPRFFTRDAANLPYEWLKTMKASIESVVAPFSALRMVRDYAVGAYVPAAEPRRG
ncbi:MAG: alpha-glucan phosphorylase, partial [Vicinamibacteria bacterium]